MHNGLRRLPPPAATGCCLLLCPPPTPHPRIACRMEEAYEEALLRLGGPSAATPGPLLAALIDEFPQLTLKVRQAGGRCWAAALRGQK